ncbi:monooxygenase [Kerstersia sp.]|uniref:monooxygenase n=1 Tax=Kerstersia sp. TaxID=1930783 RepID=UPI003F9330F2
MSHIQEYPAALASATPNTPNTLNTSSTPAAPLPADSAAPAYPAWGTPPSERYEALAQNLRPVFARIRASAVERDLQRRLPHDEIRWLRAAGFTRLRLPAAQGGQAATLTELFGLLVELGEADTNVVNALRAHLGFTEEVLSADPSPWRDFWLERLSQGDLIGAGLSEAGPAQVGSFATRLSRGPEGWRLDGRKFYTTGSLFADWISVAAQDHEGNTHYLQVARQAPGVEVVDDWDGFGQALTASGTAIFTQVAVEDIWIKPGAARFPYAVPFYQLVHLASLAGIGRALAGDVARRLQQRDRVYSHGNSASAAQDPQLLQVVGRAHAAAYTAGALTLHASQAVQRSHDAHRQRADPGEARFQTHPQTQAQTQAAILAHVEVDQAVSVLTRLVLEASTELFDALGASATLRQAGLDRYWRNARTISSHNPRVYRERQVGDFAVNGAAPPTYYRVGTSAAGTL